MAHGAKRDPELHSTPPFARRALPSRAHERNFDGSRSLITLHPTHLPVSERRYSDDEVQRILDSAVESDAALTAGATQTGMTLAEIQRIAEEAGVSPVSVTAAAAAIDRVPAVRSSSRMLGLAVGVGNTVPLPRPLDNVEWHRLVAFLRDTFEARGRVEEVAGRREWRNGNLRISVETIGDTAVLEMRTRKSNARSLMAMGLSLLCGAAVGGTLVALGQASPAAAHGVLTIALTGTGITAAGAVQLPWWSSTRRKQFEAVGEYAQRLSAGEDAARLR